MDIRLSPSILLKEFIKGDLASPLMYVIISKGLDHFIKWEVSTISIQGLSISPNMDPLSHLLFVDATLLLETPSRENIKPSKKH